MARKTYKSLTGILYTFPVKTKDRVHWVSLSGDQGDYATSSKEVQAAIENHPLFLNKKIGADSLKEEKGEKPAVDPQEFPEVTDLNEAVAVLKGEPYRVHHAKLKSKNAVLAIAQEFGVLFPNLSLE